MTRILVIDDDLSVGVAIQTLLRHRGYDVVLARSGLAGTDAFRASHFDAVMVDLFMPGMDGLETVTSIRRLAPSVPIVAMSGFRFSDSTPGFPDFLDMATKLGATACLRKPFGPSQLLAAVADSLAATYPCDRAVGA
jgi:CheY-like chemotaxis protein